MTNPATLSPAIHGDERLARGVAAAIALSVLLLGLLMASCPLDTLLSRFHPDDAFYYYNTARNFARTGFSSFDGLHFTNGYQPLWFLVCTAVFLVFPTGGEAPVRILLLVQVALSASATFLLVRLVARRCTPLAAAVAFLPFVMCTQFSMTNGLETSLLMLCLGWLLTRLDRCMAMPAAAVRPRDLLWLGVAGGLTFLARTDSAFLLSALALALVWRHGVRRWRLLAWFAVPLALLAGGYLATNLWLTGHLMPVSGAAKVYHSRLIRHDAVARLGKWEAWTQNVFWPFHQTNLRYLAFAIVVPWLLLAGAGWMRGLRDAFQPLIRLWPLAAGVTASWLFYGIAFWGGLSQANWYYPPHAFLACLVLAMLDAAVTRAAEGRVPDGLTALAGASWLLSANLESGIGLLVLVVGALPMWLLPGQRGIVGWLLLLGMTASVVLASGQGNEGLLWSVLIVVTLAGVLARSTRVEPKAVLAGALVALCVTVRQGSVLERLIRDGPTNWNWNLYLGALWAREHLPLDATIWSGSAGILGYFADRTTVNTDGLANSYEFLDEVLRAGKMNENGMLSKEMREYLQPWDFAIDALADERLLARWFPGGRFVPLPPELSPRRLQFEDIAGVRSLRVYQMRTDGKPWPPVPTFALRVPEAAEFPVGAKVPLRWSAASVMPGTRVSLCHDADDGWNGNETWIFVDTVAARPGEGSYEWDTRGLPGGEYHIGGYLFDVVDGVERWTRARAGGRIILRDPR